MRYLKKHNEEVFWRKAKVDDLYKHCPHVWKKSSKSIPKDNIVTGYNLAGINGLISNLRKFNNPVTEIGNKGCIMYDDRAGFYWSKQNPTKNWYSFGNIYSNLRKIANDLGYKINSEINVKKGASIGKIIDIIDVCFYKVSTLDFTSNEIDYMTTLLFRVNVDGTEMLFLPHQIVPTGKFHDMSIVDEVIKENFYDLIDDGIVKFSTSKIIDKQTYYNCQLDILVGLTPDTLNKISQYIKSTSDRLLDNNIKLSIYSISTSEIIFKAIQQ